MAARRRRVQSRDRWSRNAASILFPRRVVNSPLGAARARPSKTLRVHSLHGLDPFSQTVADAAPDVPTALPLRPKGAQNATAMAFDFQEAILMGNAVRGPARSTWLATADGKLVCRQPPVRETRHSGTKTV